MAHLPILGIALLGVTISACGLTGGPGQIGTPLPLERFRAEPHAFRLNSGLTQSRRMVIGNADEWAAVWADIWRGTSTPPEVPHVDFAQHMVVVAAMGQRPTGGYDILLEAASDTSSAIIVDVRSVAPGSSCVTTQALTEPVDIARIPRSTRPVSFRDHTVVRQCD